MKILDKYEQEIKVNSVVIALSRQHTSMVMGRVVKLTKSNVTIKQNNDKDWTITIGVYNTDYMRRSTDSEDGATRRVHDIVVLPILQGALDEIYDRYLRGIEIED